MEQTRRGFLAAVSSTALAGCMSGTFAGDGRPDLRLGVLSDIHLGIDHGHMKDFEKGPLGTRPYFEKALRYFRERGVDAIVIAGDLTEFGTLAELRQVAESWSRVFPDDRGADGKKVERVFILGNHDAVAWRYISTWTGEQWQGAERDRRWRESIAHDPAAAWRECFKEPFAPISVKRVKGYSFVCAHWLAGSSPDGDPRKGVDAQGLEEFFAAHHAELRGDRPFFYVQHAHPKGTCLSPFASHDSGVSTRVLSAFPNAVAFSGHAHQPLTDERNVWQGSFVSIGTASMINGGGRLFRDNATVFDYGVSPISKMPVLPTGECRQGLYVTVRGDELNIERRDFNWGVEVGSPWQVVLGEPEHFAAQVDRIGVPAFPSGAKPVVTDDGKHYVVKFPAAGLPRAYDYEARVVIPSDDYERTVCSKRVLASDYHLPNSKIGRPGEIWFAKEELPAETEVRVEVYPVSSLGGKGEPISACFTVKGR